MWSKRGQQIKTKVLRMPLVGNERGKNYLALIESIVDVQQFCRPLSSTSVSVFYALIVLTYRPPQRMDPSRGVYDKTSIWTIVLNAKGVNVNSEG